ncbi:MAG TPA: glycosyltransferase family 2 protein [Nitrososphaera sp.]|jgi:glycosyltransferase involved in cell wall biosynthesis|nr:glycosyltransferase family 2 protein [Nitrososphaera sp.]
MTSSASRLTPTHTALPLVTVVTPVHNGAQYLAECIASVLAQTYENWEYIITENCSTDASLKIALQYAQKDSRIRVHQNSKFVSAEENHHIAFRLMSPESVYCKIVHADDWLFPECLAKMVQVAEAHPSVGIVGAYRLNGAWVDLDGLPHDRTVVSGREICRARLLEDLMVFGSPSSLLFRSSVIRETKNFFDSSSFPRHWDTAACYEVLQRADFGFVHQVLTFTRRHTGARGAFSDRIETYIADELLMLQKYGPIYLDEHEYKRCWAQATKQYYTFLAKSIFVRREKEFWKYHWNTLQRLQNSFSTGRLMRAALIEAAIALCHPFSSMRKLLRYMVHES